MNEIQIKTRLKNVFDDYVKTLPSELAGIMNSNAYFTGGCIPSMFLNEGYSDYDIYLETEEAAKAIREYYCNIIGGPFNIDKSIGKILSGEETFITNKKLDKYEPKVITKHAISLEGDGGAYIQIITSFYGRPGNVVQKFDFKHLQCWYRPFTDGLTVYDHVYRLLILKKLVYTGNSDFPVNALLRLEKYIRRGWNVDPLIYVAILADIFRKTQLHIDDYQIDVAGIIESEVEQSESQPIVNADVSDEVELNNRILNMARGVDPSSRLSQTIESLLGLNTDDLINKISKL